jgi:hypothetical protein
MPIDKYQFGISDNTQWGLDNTEQWFGESIIGIFNIIAYWVTKPGSQYFITAAENYYWLTKEQSQYFITEG